MERYLETTMAAILLICILLPFGTGLQVGYHDAPIENFSSPMKTNSTWGPPSTGGYLMGGIHPLSGGYIAVPFPEYEDGNGTGAIAVFLEDPSEPDIVLELGLMNGTVPQEFLFTGDMDGDRAPDALVRDSNGTIHLISRLVRNKGKYLNTTVPVLRNTTGPFSASDIDGDMIPELLVTGSSGERLLSYSFADNPPSKVSETSLPLSASGLYAGMEITGDGVPDAVVWNDTFLFVMENIVEGIWSNISLHENISRVAAGDLDGDDIDDLLLVRPEKGLYGTISVLMGKDLVGERDLDDTDWPIMGDAKNNITGDQRCLFSDLDADGSDDLLISDPGWNLGTGKLHIIYGGPEKDYSSPLLLRYSDADIMGNGTGKRLGGGLFLSSDIDGDDLPDTVVTHGNELRNLDLPEGMRSPSPTLIRFVETGTPKKLERAQLGEEVEIRCIASGGSGSRIDSFRVGTRTIFDLDDPEPRTRSWTLLRETGADTGVFIGHIELLNGTVPGRSHGVEKGDTISVEVDGSLEADVLDIRGSSWSLDPPQFDGLPHSIKAVEDTMLDVQLRAFDPDGDPIYWETSDLPGWLEFEEGRLFGTPDNGDVGSYGVTVNITDGMLYSSATIPIDVGNSPPELVPLSTPDQAWEGFRYVSRFDYLETGGIWSVSLNSSGPINETWLEVHANGTVSGTPENLHVGLWDFNLTISDDYGGSDHVLWNVTVINQAPIMEAPEITEVLEWEEVVLDFNCSSEGDGLTVYSLAYSSVDGDLDPYTGKYTFRAIIDPSQIAIVTLDAVDVWGGEARLHHEVMIENRAPVLTSDLPTTFMAGELTVVDLDSNEEEWGISYALDKFHPPSSSMWLGLFDRNGVVTIYPWNSHAGNHSYNVYLYDGLDGTNYTWEFQVIQNTSFDDPSASFTVDRLTAGILAVNVDVEGQGFQIDRGFITIIPNDSSSVNPKMMNITEPFDEYYEFDVSDLNGTVTVELAVFFELHDGFERVVFFRKEVEIPVEKESGDTSSGFEWALFIVIILTVTAAALAAAFLVERTSFRLQTALVRGGHADEDVVLSAVQDNPGVRFKELSSSISMARKDLLASVKALREKGHVRAVPDGTAVRFLPTVGSFVDGPLVLSRYQARIANLILDRKRVSFDEIKEGTGLSSRKLERELSLMELKGAVSRRTSGGEEEYSLTPRQRSRLKEWIGSDRR